MSRPAVSATGRALALWCAASVVLGAAQRAQGFPGAESYGPQDTAAFDYYVLALSWTPTFCATHPSGHAECGVRRGFTVHGLWPQYGGGGAPEHCSGADELDPEAVERARPAMPDERLIRHEWVVHGTCSGLSPHDYFATLVRAIGRLSIPPQFDGEKPRSLTAAQIVAAFEQANPSLTARSIALRCRGPQLEEVRICLSRDLRPERCGRDVRSHCGSGPLTIGVARP